MALTERLEHRAGTELHAEVEEFLDLVDRMSRNPWSDGDVVRSEQAGFLADLGRRPALAAAAPDRRNPWREVIEQVGGQPAT